MDGLDLGFDGLMASLSAIGADSLLTLPGVDEPTTPTDYICRVLALMREREVPFEQAWSSAINRIQAPQGEGGLIEDPRVGEQVLAARASLEEDRPFYQAAYEQRPMTTIERARCTLAGWRRWEGTGTATGKRAA